MGTFYGSVLVRTEKSDEVQKALDEVAKATNCKFLIGPAVNGWISAFPDNSGQNEKTSVEIAKRLPNDIFHLIVHDDDVFAYFFFRNGQLVDQYDSCPDYFKKVSPEEKQRWQGRPEVFQDLLTKSGSLNKLKTLLAANQEKYTFEHERMAQFVELLDLSNALSSYEYLQSGEHDGIKGWKQFVHMPDLTAEKTAKRAGQAKIKAEKKRLQNEGILLAEIKPSKEKGAGLPASIAWGTDPSSHGLLLTWSSHHFTRAVDDEQMAMELFSFKPPWNTPLEPLGLKTNWTANDFCMSPSGNWLAGGFAFGDWTMRVWNWRRRELVFEVAHTRSVFPVGFSQDEQLVYSLGGEEFTVTSMVTKQPTAIVKGLAGARKASVHPSGKFAAINFQAALGIIDLEKGQLIKKLSVNRRMESLFATFPKDAMIRACLKSFLDNPKIRQSLGISPEHQAAILQDPKTIESLGAETQQKIKSLLEKVQSNSRMSHETKESIFDVCFSPDGGQLFVASKGIRVFDWNKLLLANEDAPAPELSVDAPRDDENDPNSRPLAYCVRFDPVRNLLLSSCLAGVIQYLNIKNGQSGTLLKPPDEELSIWRLELTSDGKALCCHCAIRPSAKNLNKRLNYLQVWNYPALCKAAALD